MAGVRLKPDEQQRESIRRIEESGSGAALVASDTGTGKTLIGAELLRPNEVSLIIAPLPTHASWAGDESHRDFPPVLQLDSSPARIRTTLRLNSLRMVNQVRTLLVPNSSTFQRRRFRPRVA